MFLEIYYVVVKNSHHNISNYHILTNNIDNGKENPVAHQI